MKLSKDVLMVAALLSAPLNEVSNEIINEAEIASAYEIAMNDMQEDF